MSTYRIMTFDGGGVLGAVSMRLLERIDKQVDGLLDGADLLAGTSVGATNALGLALGFSPTEMMLLYTRPGMRLVFFPFPTDEPSRRGVDLPLYRDLAAGLGALLTHVGFLDRWLEKTLDALDKRVLIPAFELLNDESGSWEPVFFNNFPGSESADLTVLDAAARAGTAPIYLPSHQGYVDGWVIANNPCTAALSAVLDPCQGGQRLDDVRILSFGIGRVRKSVAGTRHNWGAEQWLNAAGTWSMIRPPLLDALFSNSSQVNSGYCEKILGARRFLRLDAPLGRVVPMDAVDELSYLKEQADAVDIGPYVRWIEENWLPD